MANLSNINNKFVVEQTTGYVGVGTTDPNFLIEAAGTNSEIALNSTNGSIYRVRSTSNDEFIITKNGVADRLVISSGGNVGIGATLPAEKLEVSGGHIKITNSGNTNLYINADAANADATIFFEESDSVKAKIQHDASNDSMLFTDGSYTDTMTLKGGSVGIGTTSPAQKVEIAGGFLKFSGGDYGIQGSASLTYNPVSDHYFQASGSTKVTIKANGNVGIGTTLPSSKLEVKMNDSANNRLGFTGDGSTTGAAMWTNWQTGNSYLDFRLGGTTDTYTKMRINSSGNVGIDVSAPDSYNSSARKLVVGGSGDSGITISTSSTNMGTLMFADGTGGTAGYRGRVSYDHDGDYMRFDTAASERMRINNGGNVGIGVTPSTSYTDSRAIELGANGYIWSEQTASIYGSFMTGVGFYYNSSGATEYKTTNLQISRHVQYQGEHLFQYAAAGTAGGAITWSEAFRTLDTGAVSIGTTSSFGKLTVDNASGNTITIRKGTGTPSIAFGGTNANEAVGLLEGVAGGGFKFYIGSGTLASSTWNQGFIIASDGDVYNYQSLNKANTFYGAYAGNYSSNTSGNTFMGYNVGNNLTTGNNNTGVGRDVFIATVTGGENTAIGRGAGRLIGTGSRNSLLGDGAGDKLANGSDNVAIGYHALYALNSSQNVAIGVNAGLSFTGSRLVAIGTDAAKTLSSDVDNVFIGQDCGHHRTGGIDNTFVGAYANYNGNATGEGNTGIGKSAGYELTSGSKNTYVGRQAGYYTRAHGENTYLGWNAGLYFNSSENTAVGSGALLGNSSGSSGNSNSALGRYAGNALSSGNRNTFIGHQAGIFATTADNCTFVGKGSGDSVTTGDNNTFLGHAAGDEATIGDYNICIGHGSGSGSSPFHLTNQSGRVVIGDNNTTNAYIKVSWTVTSDKRDKTDFKEIEHGLDFVNKLKPTEYKFRKNRETEETDGKKRYGFLAQEILELEGDNPVIIDAEQENHLKYQESNLIPVLVKAIQELKADNDSLKARIETLENK